MAIYVNLVVEREGVVGYISPQFFLNRPFSFPVNLYASKPHVNVEQLAWFFRLFLASYLGMANNTPKFHGDFN